MGRERWAPHGRRRHVTPYHGMVRHATPRDLEDGRLGILVDGDDGLRVLHAREVLDRACPMMQPHDAAP